MDKLRREESRRRTRHVTQTFAIGLISHRKCLMNGASSGIQRSLKIRLFFFRLEFRIGRFFPTNIPSFAKLDWYHSIFESFVDIRLKFSKFVDKLFAERCKGIIFRIIIWARRNFHRNIIKMQLLN